MTLCWKDKKDEELSTIYSAQMAEVENGQKKMKTAMVVVYNGTMTGVDVVDQHLSSCPVSRKQKKKCYRKAFCHLLNQCCRTPVPCMHTWQ
jgi:hypothetical protein